MPSDYSLFRPDDLLSREELRANAASARSPEQADRDLDTASLWRSQDDGLLVRGVKPHSAPKSRLVSRGLETVTEAMKGKWFAQKYGLHYLELFSGPGKLLDESTGKEELGSPLQALSVRRPFQRYVFSDVSEECVEALRARVRERTEATVLCGDANDAAHLEHATDLLDPRALVVIYLDPARPRDLTWSTVEYLARRFEFVDLIVNLPVNSLCRAIHGAHATGHRGPGVAGMFLNHEEPWELLRPRSTPATFSAIREHYDRELMALGFRQPARWTTFYPAETAYYDVLLASRHPAALDLWNRANPAPANPQLTLDAMDEGGTSP